MQRFDIGSLSSWNEVGMGELVLFSAPGTGSRVIQFECLSPVHVAVYATIPHPEAMLEDEQPPEGVTWLVGCGTGLTHVRFATANDVYIYCSAEEGFEGSAYLRYGTEAQVIKEKELPSFTNLRPRAAGPSDEYRRMLLMMQLNHNARERKLAEEMDAMRSTLGEALAARNAAPAPTPSEATPAVTPAPEPKV